MAGTRNYFIIDEKIRYHKSAKFGILHILFSCGKVINRAFRMEMINKEISINTVIGIIFNIYKGNETLKIYEKWEKILKC